MSISDFFTSGSGDPTVDAFFKAQTMSSISSKLTDRFLPSDSQRLDELDRRLSIRMKKRALGLPESTDDYEELQNDDGPSHWPAVAIHGLESIPTPEFLKRPLARALIGGSTSPNNLAGTAEAFLGAGARAGASHGSSGILRFIGRR